MKKKKKPIKLILDFFEYRIDVILFRIGWFNSIFQSRQAIICGSIFVCKKLETNFKIIKNCSYRLAIGEIIKIKKKTFLPVKNKLNFICNYSSIKVFNNQKLFLFYKKNYLNDYYFPFQIKIKNLLCLKRCRI